MKGFSTRDGDVVIGKTIEMVSNGELLRQKVERVLGTNKGEWSHDTEEGIDFPTILRKNPDEEEIRRTIEDALVSIDESFTISEFSLTMNGRHATIKLRAANADGEEIGGEYEYAD